MTERRADAVRSGIENAEGRAISETEVGEKNKSTPFREGENASFFSFFGCLAAINFGKHITGEILYATLLT